MCSFPQVFFTNSQLGTPESAAVSDRTVDSVHGGVVLIRQAAWSHFAFSIDASTGLSLIFANGINARSVYEGGEARAGDLKTGARGIGSGVGGEGGEGIFIGTWFVIGPWEGGKSMDFSKTHPPETRIELDGKYYDGKFANEPGHIDQFPGWRFYQSDRRRCEPPRVYGSAIYYWFTEVYSDKDREVIFGTGQDDGGRVWLNDVLIYEDNGRQGSADAIFEEIKGLRRVILRKGFNRILVRHENGPTFCHQRIAIMPDDAVEVSEEP